MRWRRPSRGQPTLAQAAGRQATDCRRQAAAAGEKRATPESRSEAELALSSDPVFDEDTFSRIKDALLIYSDIQVRGGWPMLPRRRQARARRERS